MSEDSLLTTIVPRTLETKNKILGLELSDVLLLLLNISVENLIFGSTPLKIPMVFGSTLLFAAVLFLFKRGKPDGYVQHYAEYLMSPTVFAANAVDEKYRRFSERAGA